MDPVGVGEQQNRIVGIVGRKGAGKSQRAGVLLQYAPRVVVWDPMDDHGAAVPDVFDDDLAAFLAYFQEARRAPRYACSYVPGGELELELEQIAGAVYDGGRVLFVVEEVPLVCRANFLSTTFGRLVRTGRHQQIDLLWTAQRASEVSRTLTSATDIWIFFSQTEPRDLDAIAERCGRDIADQVAGLGLHESFTWDVIARATLEPSPRLLKRF